MIPHMLYVHSQPSCGVIYVYINAQMVIIMLNEIFLGLLMIITDFNDIIDINDTISY